jgi:hypothetical protein
LQNALIYEVKMGDIYTVCRWMRNTFERDNADVGGMRKMVAQMIKTSKIHELITYSANVLLSTLSPVNMRATLLRFVES